MIMGSTRIGVRVLPVGLLFSTCFLIAPFVLSVKCFTHKDLPLSDSESGFLYHTDFPLATPSIIPKNNNIVTIISI